MIVVKITGGLGNQMFQYAAARRLAFRHRTELKLDISHYQDQNEELITRRIFRLNDFNIEGGIAADCDLCEYRDFLQSRFKVSINKILARFRPGSQRKYVFQRRYNFHPAILGLPDNTYLDGTWQSELYFADIKEMIRRDFTPKRPLGRDCTHLIQLINNSNSVAVHVRRGDYLQASQRNLYLEPCKTDYYRSTTESIRKVINNPRFFFFSDDINWVEHNLAVDSRDILISKFTMGDEFVDFVLMTSCKHHIIANSSFSWWAAWLNRNPSRVVYAPKQWYRDPRIDTAHLIPGTWELR